MFNSAAQSPHSPPHIDHAMKGLNIKGKPVSESECRGGLTPTFATLMEKLAGKIQGSQQTVRQFAAQVQATVITIHQSHPEEMNESCVSQVKRTQFFHGLKRTFKETFRHLYEEEEASFEELLQAVSTMEEVLNSLMKVTKSEEVEQSQVQPSRRSTGKSSSKNHKSWGWTRTGLEPEVVVYVNNQPLDVILDLGSSVSLIDIEIAEDLEVPLTPYLHEVPQCVSIEGFKLTNSKTQIIG